MATNKNAGKNGTSNGRQRGSGRSAATRRANKPTSGHSRTPARSARTTGGNGTNGSSTRRGESGTRSEARTAATSGQRKVRYAVIGLGYISQIAVLPAFAHAGKNSELVALVSSDPEKLDILGRRYGVEKLYDYDNFEVCLEAGEIDAVYIATPNSEHLPFVRQAAAAGVHVLCEKPLAVTTPECREIIEACDRGGVKLMTAYRLHFEAANLRALEIARSGKIGDLRAFNSCFTMQVRDPENIRVDPARGGGPLHDIGIYCINAARSLFGSEPESVFAFGTHVDREPLQEITDTVAVAMRFPGERVATFICSFGAADTGYAHLVGTKGDICLDPAYEYAEGLGLCVTIDGKTQEREFAKRDQFAAELVYFSDCVLNDREPEPSGEEGMADVRVIRAIQQSLRTGGQVLLNDMPQVRHPHPRQRIDRPAIRKPQLVNAVPPSLDK